MQVCDAEEAEAQVLVPETVKGDESADGDIHLAVVKEEADAANQSVTPLAAAAPSLPSKKVI